MKLRSRLLFFGAFVPTLLMACGFVATGVLLDRQLFEATDRALLTQAAVESVSLFDGTDGAPHLHLARSRLTGILQGFTPEGALYDDHGARVAVFAPAGHAPARLDVARVGDEPRLSTVTRRGHEHREMLVSVESPRGASYVLWMSLPLDGILHTRGTYARTAGFVLLAASLLFFLLQRAEAARLSERLERLAAHASRLRGEDFEAPLADDVGDVVSDLRDALADATARLRAAHEAEKRLVADAAHELRTPLTAMRAVIDTTLRRERSNDELRDALLNARAEVDRLAALSSELLDLASLRQTSARREPTDVARLVDEAVAALAPLGDERDVRVRVERETDQTEVRIVPSQVRRAVENLVVNAIRFAPRGTGVRVTLSDARSALRVSVSDEGEGVPEGERDAIFEPFRRGGGASGRGAGLGLAIVRDVARRHGGDAWVEATDPAGASFRFELARRGEEGLA